MKITVEQLRQIISEEVDFFVPEKSEQPRYRDEALDVFVAPKGFSKLLNRESLMMLAHDPGAREGVYNQNNGNIVAITDRGPFVWINTGHGDRTTAYRQAIASVEDMGYQQASIHVPSSAR